MAIDSTTSFNVVIVDFDGSKSLGIDSITVYNKTQTMKDDLNLFYHRGHGFVETVPLFNADLPGIYNADDNDFKECVKRIVEGTAELHYTFDVTSNAGKGVSLQQAKGDNSRVYGHILAHDPIYRETRRREGLATFPMDKILYRYDDSATKPALPAVSTLTDTMPEDMLLKIEAGDGGSPEWYQSIAKAENAAGGTAGKTLYKCLVTFSMDLKVATDHTDNVLVAEVTAIDAPEYEVCLPVTLMTANQ